MHLWEYEGKRVKIVDDDGNITVGLADFYTSELDDPNGVASLTIRPDGVSGALFEFEENEIAHIEIIPEATYAEPGKLKRAVAA
ncbi:MAG: hypothetical protein LBE35_02245 [Clostridiales bacterium]|nr:hypothetical protein [Clostridiales bacterium]